MKPEPPMMPAVFMLDFVIGFKKSGVFLLLGIDYESNYSYIT
jgi:hypothetical protein